MTAAGCVTGPPAAASATTRPWAFDGVAGQELRSAHYRLLTTVADPAVTAALLRVLETAYARYAALVPPDPGRSGLLEVELFAEPGQWEAFTRRLTGDLAPTYLSVGAGGYAYGDRFVCWLANPGDLWGVAAHEGFHQYAARHLAARLPPAVEEGLATCYESVAVGPASVEIDEAGNARREAGVANARRAGRLLPLDTLVRLNAGDVAGLPTVDREGFYGQCWVLARLLKGGAAYAPGLRRLMADSRDGRVRRPVGVRDAPTLYYPARVRGLLTEELGVSWPTLERDYDAALGDVPSAVDSR